MFLNKTNGTKGNKGIDEGSTIEEGENNRFTYKN
jgi:hypothetical protein